MKKIIVIGCPGSGKSTVSRELHNKTGIPLYHLDMMYWNADKTTVEKSLFLERLSAVLEKDEWVMLNPEIIKKDGAYDTEEGCLSLLGGPRKCKRYKTIKVQYQTLDMQTRTKNFTGWTAQIIQHEVDHCNGILI